MSQPNNRTYSEAMDSKATPMRTIDPQPMPEPSSVYTQSYPQEKQPPYSQPQPQSQSQPNESAKVSNLAMRSGLEYGEIVRPFSALDGSRGLVQASSARDVKALKTNCQYNLGEYLTLTRQRSRYDPSTVSDLDGRIRMQAGVVLGDLRTLQGEIRDIIKSAEGNRWRRWIIGGAMATFIPFIRKIFRRGSDKESKAASNNTEYAFQKSQSLISHIKEGVLGKGRFASIAFFVCAVLYVFSSEVTLRVAKTVQKRIKKLCARIERGEGEVSEKDIKMLEGWRWRVLLW